MRNLLLILGITLSLGSTLKAQLYVDEADGNKLLDVNPSTFAATPGFTTITSGIHDPSAIYVYGNYIYVDNNARGSSNGDSTASAISVYNATTGALVDSSLVSGLSGSRGLTLEGNTLYVSNSGTNSVSAYTIDPLAPTTAIAVSGFSLTGLSNPQDIAYYNGNIYVVNASGSNTVSLYNGTTGALITSNFISTGAVNPQGIAISSTGILYVVNNNYGSAGTIGEYNATTGVAINTALDTISAGNWPTDIVVSGSDLFVTDYTNEQVTEYSATTANDTLATSSSLGSAVSPFGIAVDMPVTSVTATPEPRSYLLGLLVLVASVVLLYPRLSSREMGSFST